jgi:hypothetical protein
MNENYMHFDRNFSDPFRGDFVQIIVQEKSYEIKQRQYI